MSIYDLKRLNIANGGRFFDKDKTKGEDALSNLGVRRVGKGEVEVYRKHGTPREWRFNSETGRMI